MLVRPLTPEEDLRALHPHGWPQDLELQRVDPADDGQVRRFADASTVGFRPAGEPLSAVLEEAGLFLFCAGSSLWRSDGTAQGTFELAKLGGRSYDYLIRFNRGLNNTLMSMGRERVSLSKTVKDNVKRIVKSNVADFEDIACEHAIQHGYDYVICGHIHKPQIRKFSNKQGEVIYMNSGDWIENCTSLEYTGGKWELFHYFHDHQFKGVVTETDEEAMDEPKKA